MKGKKQKDKFNNLTLSRGSSMSFLLVSVLIKRFDPGICMGFLHHKLLIILNKTFSFAQMDGPEAPITSSLISVEVI